MSGAPEFSRGQAYQQAGDLRQAEQVYRQLLRAEPRGANVWFALGRLCDADRRPAEAAACFRQALEIEPGEAEGHFQLGNVLVGLGQHAEAEAAFRRCLALRGDHLAARVNLAFALGEQDRLEEARACYEEVLQDHPALPEAHHNLGNVLRELGRLGEALVRYAEALRLRPDYGKAHINRGIALVALGRLDEAVAGLRRGAELLPELADAHNSLGSALSVLQQFDEADAHYRRALALKPDHAEAAWNRSLLWLLRGDYGRGWPAYEWRWRCKRPTPLPAFTGPRWDGGPLAGRTLLLYAEQGLGDTLHFVRYAALLKGLGARVVVQCQPALLGLLARTPGVDGLVGWGAQPPPYDVVAPLMSVPALVGTTVETIPAAVPYVLPDPALVGHWRRVLAPVRGFRVGVAWQGSPRHAWDRHRSVPLEALEPLARVGGVRLVSLQKGPGSEQLRALGGRFGVVDLGELLDEAAGPFMDTAAVMANLDLVVSVDSALLHLAGAAGVRAWAALPFTPDWRWLLGRDDSPWYPTLRLFRQERLGAWPGVFAAMAEALRQEVAGRPPRRAWVEVSAGELVERLALLDVEIEKAGGDAGRLRAGRDELAAQAELPEAARGAAAEMREVVARLAGVEEALRGCERGQEFGPGFVALAREFHRLRDRVAALRREIDGGVKREGSAADRGGPEPVG
jgi:tetratricopeptide (TPR) repeat protein